MKKIDIGCGGRKLHEGYDVYTDIYKSDAVKNNPEVNKRFVLASMEDMSMFKDKEFDFARCHHVIEHVNDPDKACSELIRIAKSGVLYFPTVQADILIGRADHNWLIFPIDVKGEKQKHLLFIRKRFKSYYPPHKKALPPEIRPMISLQAPIFRWKGSFKWTVVQ